LRLYYPLCCVPPPIPRLRFISLSSKEHRLLLVSAEISRTIISPFSLLRIHALRIAPL